MTSWALFNEYMLILDGLWPFIERLIPPTRDPKRTYQRKPGAGRARTSNRILVNTILYGLMTQTQWNGIMPDTAGAGYLCYGKTAHKWLMKWARQDFFERLKDLILKLFKAHCGLNLKWISIDGTMYKAPLAQESVGRNPTDRGKMGSKRSLCVNDQGIVLVMIHAGANVHDSKLLKPTLDALKLLVHDGEEIHICLDAGYTGFENIVKSYGFIPHIRPRGEEKKLIEFHPNFTPHRWIVEVKHSHINQFRRMKIRYEKLDVSHLALADLAASIMTIRTIFRAELGEDSIWHNKMSAKKRLKRRIRKIDYTKYNMLGLQLVYEAEEHNIIGSSVLKAA